MLNILKTAFGSLGVGFAFYGLQHISGSTYLTSYLRGNLITVLVALLAINSATLGIILTKIRDLVDAKGKISSFAQTRREMLYSIREQIGLIVFAAILLTIQDAAW